MYSINTINDFKKLIENLSVTHFLMPSIFIGHGSPMNGIENNEFSNHWKEIGKNIHQPTAVLVISAHWFTSGTQITSMDFPKTIHDFSGFPDDLYQIQYPAPGDVMLANEAANLIQSTTVQLTHEWGLDHGAWTVLRHMYPEANIPVIQMSIDYTKDARFHYLLGKELFQLRKKGVLILGSGNIVHNLRLVAWDKLHQTNYGFDWAISISNLFKHHIAEGHHNALIEYQKLGKEAIMAVPTPEHYLPLLYVLGLQTQKDSISFFNDKHIGGSLTMTSLLVG